MVHYRNEEQTIERMNFINRQIHGFTNAVEIPLRQRRRNRLVVPAMIRNDLATARLERRHLRFIRVDATWIDADGEVCVFDCEIQIRPRGVIVHGAAPEVLQYRIRELRLAVDDIIREYAGVRAQLETWVHDIAPLVGDGLVRAANGFDLRGVLKADAVIQHAGAATQDLQVESQMRGLVDNAVLDAVERVEELDLLRGDGLELYV